MNVRKVSVLFCYLFLFSISCIDSYESPGIDPGGELLVVGGFINSNGPTTIQLGRSMALNDKRQSLPELKAQVRVEDDNNHSYTLAETGGGLYTIGSIAIDPKRKYRIQIKRLNQRQYVSDLSEVKQTPPVDSVTWEIDETKRGIQVYVYTHDPNNATRYYNWEYVETWKYHADLTSYWEYINGQTFLNANKTLTYFCWNTRNSTSINIASTNRLDNDVVYRFPLLFIPASSPKVEIGYYLLVKQYAVTSKTYDYLYNLKLTTEQQGSIFDPQPSYIAGNIHCLTDENEKVLGNVAVLGTQEKSIFISNIELPGWFTGRTSYGEDCPSSTVVGFTPSQIAQMLRDGILLPADNPVSTIPSTPIYQKKYCVDCRESGGSLTKPSYWPN